MYERFYGLHERPFSLLPDPDFLYPGRNHRAALDLLELAVLNQAGFCVISGEIGSGKTTLIRELLNRLDERIRVGLVSNTHPSFGELLQWILAAYGLPDMAGNKLERHQRFIDFVIEQYAGNRRTLLIIDEAQNLAPEALEELRMLSNVNSEKDFVLQVILVGQNELRDKLMDPQLKQFAQRIAFDYHLENLDAGETRDYIRHRLRHAGGRADIFSDPASGAVYEHTGGVPRLINRLCDLCLVYGYSEEQPVIDAGLVDRVADAQCRGMPSCDRGMAPVSTPPAAPDSPVPTVEVAPVTHDAVVEASSPVAKEDVDLHRLVVATEQPPATGRRRGGTVWLLGVLMVAGVAGWMTRDLWWQPVRLTLQQAAVRAQVVVTEAWNAGWSSARLAVPAKDKKNGP